MTTTTRLRLIIISHYRGRAAWLSVLSKRRTFAENLKNVSDDITKPQKTADEDKKGHKGQKLLPTNCCLIFGYGLMCHYRRNLRFQTRSALHRTHVKVVTHCRMVVQKLNTPQMRTGTRLPFQRIFDSNSACRCGCHILSELMSISANMMM